MERKDLLAPPPLKLPADPAEGLDLTARETALAHPGSPAVWVARAEAELEAVDNSGGDLVVAYAYARTGYHRSLDRLRHNGWKGWGPVPASHEPNLPVLRAIAMLGRVSRAIGDEPEYARCREMLEDADPKAVETLLP